MEKIELNFPYNSKYPIIDNEISNDISMPKGQDWKYEEGKVICLACLYGDKIICILKTKNENEESYKKEMINILDSFYLMFAFNYNMEKGNFKGFLGKDYRINEIKAFKGKGKNKEWFFQELINDKIIDYEKLKKEYPFLLEDKFTDDSGKIIEEYAKENPDYNSIMIHNLCDVIKQYFILIHKDYFLEKYKDKVDRNGWFNG